MEWENIIYKARLIKERFQKSYKCINTDRETRQETVHKHINVLVEQLEQLRILFNVHYHRLTQTHKTYADAFYYDIREKLLTVSSKKGLEIKIPQSLHEPIVFNPLEDTYDSKPIPSPRKMAQTVVEFINMASRLIPEFDGSPDNLRSFIDALQLVDSLKDTHESTAVSLVKTKLRGSARNIISTETTLPEIISKLRATVKGESVDVVLAKLMNVRQQGKTANNYAKEIEELTKKLETSYINDGLPSHVATKYATTSATKAIIKNASNDRVKLIMESGSFSDLNEVISKFITSCTEAYGQENSILTYGDRRQGYNNGNQNRAQNRTQNRNFQTNRNNTFNSSRNNNGSFNSNNNYNNNNNNNNGRNRNNNYNSNNGSYRSNNGNRNRNVNNNDFQNRNISLTAENDSGNGQAPLSTQ